MRLCGLHHYKFCSTSKTLNLFHDSTIFIHMLFPLYGVLYRIIFLANSDLHSWKVYVVSWIWVGLDTPLLCLYSIPSVCVCVCVCVLHQFLCCTPSWRKCYHRMAPGLSSLKKNNVFLVVSQEKITISQIRYSWNLSLAKLGTPRWLSGKETSCKCRRHRRHGFDPWVRMVPWRRKWQPIPVF